MRSINGQELKLTLISAANNLYVSQPSLSYSVKTLEEQLGYKLFNKENNKIALTEKGEELYNKLNKK